MRTNVHKFVNKWRICQYAKGKIQNTRMYTPLPILNRPWDSVNMDFLLGFMKKQKGNDSIFAVFDRFSKNGSFYSMF